MFISLALLALFAIIWYIPSGKKCPECNKHFTTKFKALAIKQSTNKEVNLEFSHCYSCGNKFDFIEDGKPVSLDAENEDGSL